MLVNNLGSLKAELARYMFQQRFAPDYDTAIQNFEAAANRRLRVLKMEMVADLTTTGGDCPLPFDYLQWRTVQWTGTTPHIDLDYVHPAYLNSTWPSSSNNLHNAVFTIEGSTFKARPPDDTAGAYEFHYYGKIPTINTGSDTATNWLISEWPDAYLFGALTELFALGRNADAAVLWKQRRDETFAEIIRLSSFTTGATSAMVRTGEYF